MDEPIEADFTPLPPMDLAPDRHMFYRFELSAWPAGRPDLPAPAFLEPVVVTVTYVFTDVEGLLENELRLVTFDETQASWMPISATLDVTNSHLTTSLAHFSEYGIEGTSDVFFQPGIEAGQVSLFTADSSFSYDLAMPAGVGGMKLPLTLRYSSGTPNGMVGTLNDGGWVGVGWTLDIGSIEDARLTLNGVSGQLVLDPADPPQTNCSTGGWTCVQQTKLAYLKNQNFMKAQKTWRSWTKVDGCPNGDATINNDAYWEVWDKSGIKYTFGKSDYDDMTPGHWPWPDSDASVGDSSRTFRFNGSSTVNARHMAYYLDSIEDTHGNRIEIIYESHASHTSTGSCSGFQSHTRSWKETYPKEIRYKSNDGHISYVITLTTQAKGWDEHWQKYVSQSAYKLTGLTINLQSQSGQNKLIGSYGLTYTTSGNPLRLLAVTPYDASGNPKPGVQLEYTDRSVASQGHGSAKVRPFLWRVTSGYGGTLTFGYENWCYYNPLEQSGGDPHSPCGPGQQYLGLLRQRVQTKTLNPDVAGAAISYVY